MILVLSVIWALLPLSIRTSIPVQSLSLYPLTRAQRLAFHFLSYLQNRRPLALLAASFAVIIALVRLPDPLFHIVKAAANLATSMLLGWFSLRFFVPLSLEFSLRR